MTHHAYFNLGGVHEDCDTILNHELKIFSSQCGELDDKCLSTGRLLDVQGGPFDFLDFHTVGERIEAAGGYDAFWMVDQSQRVIKPLAALQEKTRGITMDVWSDAPGVQIYTANALGKTKGKAGTTYGKYGAICLETQGHPNAINQEIFKSPILLPGDTYRHSCEYRFGNC